MILGHTKTELFKRALEAEEKLDKVEHQLLLAEMVLLRLEDKAKSTLAAGYDGVRATWVISIVKQYFCKLEEDAQFDRGGAT